ncbi:MAG TPA: ImmA/IrrE family metallo-endopeptidase [Gemmataceae bacterium]|nr:ImmA/IrrE family metallo-endopeptidase [Gemmataceae bacterium]
MRALPVSIVLLPRLRLDGVRAWLRENGVPCPCDERDRPLRACLAACRGNGLIFVDGTDGEDEQRFSLAHEMAHFLRHYWHPRRRARKYLGERVVAVLDGERPPTDQERVHALLKNVPLDFHLHLMRRGPRSEFVNAAVALAEEEADRLAYELLAPAAEALARTGSRRGDGGQDRLIDALQTDFGLPREQATNYGRLLLPPVWEDPLLRRLR